jgi:hypothetical protein
MLTRTPHPESEAHVIAIARCSDCGWLVIRDDVQEARRAGDTHRLCCPWRRSGVGVTTACVAACTARSVAA